MRELAIRLLVAVALAFSGIAQTCSQPAPSVRTDAPDATRVALVIGNANYERRERLPNARIDAIALARTLKALGFRLIGDDVQLDVSKTQFDKLVDEFIAASASAKPTAAIFYYAGHGAQRRGAQYLLPNDAPAEAESAVTGIALRSVSHTPLQDPRSYRLIIVDTCRTELAHDWKAENSTTFDGLPARVILSLSQSGGLRVDDGPQGRGTAFSRAWRTGLDSLVAKPTAGLSLTLALAKISELTSSETLASRTPQMTDSGVGPVDPLLILYPSRPTFFVPVLETDGTPAYRDACAEARAAGHPLPESLCTSTAHLSDEELTALGTERMKVFWRAQCAADPGHLQSQCQAPPDTALTIHDFVYSLRSNAQGSRSRDYWLLEAALSPLARAATHGHPPAQRLFAAWTYERPIEKLFNGTSGEQLVAQMNLFCAAFQGDAPAIKYLALVFLKQADHRATQSGDRFSLNWQVLDLLRRLAVQGDAEAAWMLSQTYFRLSRAPGSAFEEKGTTWMERAADMGSPGAAYYLGNTLREGTAVRAKDIAAAMTWYAKAFQQGVKEAAFELGLLHAEKNNPARDEAKAFEYFSQAARAEHAAAQAMLAAMYYSGRGGMARNIPMARSWLERSRKNGYARAEKMLKYIESGSPGDLLEVMSGVATEAQGQSLELDN